MLISAVTSPINHALRYEQWASKQLQSHAGKTVCIQILPFIGFKLLIDADGELQSAGSHISADVTLIFPPMILSGLIAREAFAFEQIKTKGDQALAGELIGILKQIDLSTIMAHDLSKIIGDIPAQRATQAGTGLFQWHMDNAGRLTRSLAEYLTEEQAILIKPGVIQQFAEDIKTLQHGTEQLEQRLNRLLQRLT